MAKRKRTQPWQLQEAKAKFSEVFDLAMKGEPQTVTRRGREAVVVLSRDQYTALRGGHEDPFISFLLAGPKIPGGIPVPENDELYEPRVDFSSPEFWGEEAAQGEDK
jgi:prevent-host-death family protein